MSVLIFGDSIAHGNFDAQGGWVARLVAYDFNQRLQGIRETHSIYNLSFDGDTTLDIAESIEEELQRRNKWGIDMVIVAIGVNDSRLENKKPVSDLRQFNINLEQILAKAKEFTDKVVFVSLIPIDEGQTRPTAWDENLEYIQDRVEAFNKALKKFCHIHNLQFIDFYTPMKRELEKRELLLDGVHPNSAGHQLIADLMLPELEKLL